MTANIEIVTAETQAQSLILTELQNSYQRLRRALVKIEHEASKSSAYANLDTTFLIGATTELPKLVATFESFRDAAKWAGCNRDTINAVCKEGWVLIEFDAGRLGRAEKKDTDQ